MKIHCAGAGTFPTVTEMTGVFSGLDLFSSFYDIKEVDRLVALRKHKPRSIVCDSGAHAYFSASGSGISVIKLNSRLPPPKEYVQRYAQFVSESLPFIDAYVEMDTVQLHGVKFQKWQRDCLLEAVRGDKRRLWPVYHTCEPREAVTKILRGGWHYMALEGSKAPLGGSKVLSRQDYLDIVRKCYERQVKVHIFATVSKEFLTHVPVYSSDSSSWSMVYRSGTFMRFNGKGMSPVHRTDVARRFKFALGVAQPLSKITCDREKVFRYRDLFRTALEQYEKFAKYLTDLWTARGIVWQ